MDILFADMEGDQKALDPEANLESEQEEEESVSDTQGDPAEDDEDENEEAFDDPTKYDVDIDEYVDRKGLLTIERIKDIVGEVMSTCQAKLEFEILEYIIKGKVFESKVIRESFLQEILNAAVDASYRNALEQYMNQKGLTIIQNDPKSMQAPRHERIIQVSPVDVNRTIAEEETKDFVDKGIIGPGSTTQDMYNVNYLNRLFIVTNQGISVFKKPSQKVMCKQCAEQEFCPYGPDPKYPIDYKNIKTIIQFPQMPQKIGVIYTSHNDEIEYQMTLNIPTFTRSAKIYKTLYS